MADANLRFALPRCVKRSGMGYKMRNAIFYFSLMLLLFSLSACSKNAGDDIVKEELDKPEVTAAADIIEDTEEEIEVIDGYEKIKFGEYDVYVPYVKESEKIKGVEYLDDDINISSKSQQDLYSRYNRPEGCVAANLKTNGMSYGKIGTPPFKDKDSNAEKDPTVRCEVAFPTYSESEEMIIEIDRTKKYPYYYCKYDVQCISFCLYEWFCDNCPELKISIYGVTSDVLKKYLGDENEYAPQDYTEMMEQFESNGCSECDLICSKTIEKTGVYYIDYNEINKNEKYKQFIIRTEFSEYIDNYSYDINGFCKYDINDNDKFQKWKSDNSELMIGG